MWIKNTDTERRSKIQLKNCKKTWIKMWKNADTNAVRNVDKDADLIFFDDF